MSVVSVRYAGLRLKPAYRLRRITVRIPRGSKAAINFRVSAIKVSTVGCRSSRSLLGRVDAFGSIVSAFSVGVTDTPMICIHSEDRSEFPKHISRRHVDGSQSWKPVREIAAGIDWPVAQSSSGETRRSHFCRIRCKRVQVCGNRTSSASILGDRSRRSQQRSGPCRYFRAQESAKAWPAEVSSREHRRDRAEFVRTITPRRDEIRQARTAFLLIVINFLYQIAVWWRTGRVQRRACRRTACQSTRKILPIGLLRVSLFTHSRRFPGQRARSIS